ncbi:MAG: enoyl-CoA hydratase/isomerase family protein [Ktedonobacterales bacterium]|nr:enoyl-CoA hydratase/isomerase family protein [Ktedonobacterales bacterium]
METLGNFETILLDVAGPVATVTLHRPEARNALSQAMVAELLRAFTALRDDATYEDVRVVVLRAAGQSFCVGGDVRDMGATSSPEEDRAALARLDALLRAVNEAPHVVIARVQGHALGGGLGLVCVADIAVAGYSALFGLPEVRLGLVPSVISPYVVQRIGFTCARRLMLTGAYLGPDRARTDGLIQEVCADMELDVRVAAITADVLRCAPHALRECKRLLFRVAREAEAQTLAYRVELLDRLRTSEEAQQGIAAFLTKQLPPWAPKP